MLRTRVAHVTPSCFLKGGLHGLLALGSRLGPRQRIAGCEKGGWRGMERSSMQTVAAAFGEKAAFYTQLRSHYANTPKELDKHALSKAKRSASSRRPSRTKNSPKAAALLKKSTELSKSASPCAPKRRCSSTQNTSHKGNATPSRTAPKQRMKQTLPRNESILSEGSSIAAMHTEGDGSNGDHDSSTLLGEAEEVELAAEVQHTVPGFGSDSDIPDSATGAGEEDETKAPKDNNGVDSHAPGMAAATERTVGDKAVEGGGAAAAEVPPYAPPPVPNPSPLELESPLNLRLATLTRQPGKAFRAIAVYLSMDRESMMANITFEDIASRARLVCSVEEVRTTYFHWIAQFNVSFVALFLPTLQHPNAVRLQNAILSVHPRQLPRALGGEPGWVDLPDHLLFSYTKVREVIAKKKRDLVLNPQLLTVDILNACAEEWKNFITTPLSCAPQPLLLAAFNFHSKDNVMLNKELLYAQLTIAADALLASGVGSKGSNGSHAARRGTFAAATVSSFSQAGRWLLIFVSAPARAASESNAVPPMQDLLTGQFVEPLTLSEGRVIYIIGTGTAASAFARFPVVRKGKCPFSILLEDVEARLGLRRPHRVTLTAMLAQALEGFSRLTWMGLMQPETGALRVPASTQGNGMAGMATQPPRRTVAREIVPSFLEAVFAPSNRVGFGTATAALGARGESMADAPLKHRRRLEEHIRLLFNNPDRLEKEQRLAERLRGCKVLFVDLASANVTAARRADNPFSSRNGIVDVSTQLWGSLAAPEAPPVGHLQARSNAAGDPWVFVSPEEVLPKGFPTATADAERQDDCAENGILVAWDVKRVILFLRESPTLRKFLYNGGKIWCAQYAQYLLRGFNHNNLATMERTLLQLQDGPPKSTMHPLEKLKLIFEAQLELAVATRQLNSIVHRMDGLLASSEMEINGLHLASQGEVSRFAHTLRAEHKHLEKVLQEKIMDFTKFMDDDVRQRINFRSPQDISTVIYGGALCRHLGTRFVPVRPTKYPLTSLFPHLVCHATGNTVPSTYLLPDSLARSFEQSSGTLSFSAQDFKRSLRTIQQLCKRCSVDQLAQQTSIVVIICRTKIGSLIEQFSLYCPATAGTSEIDIRVAIDDILPVSDKPDVVTIAQLRALIAGHEPLKQLRVIAEGGSDVSRQPSAGRSSCLRNLLLLTNCTHERLEALVDTGVIDVIEEAVLGPRAAEPAEEGSPFERVCFADLNKAFPPPPQVDGSFESDFSELTTSDALKLSAKANWECQTSGILELGGFEGVVKALISHCASLVGTARDPFRSTHPVPSACPRGLHGQAEASTAGMLWMVTPSELHPVLRRFLRGRSASSGADAVERVTVFLSPYKAIDLSFFAALQKLRFTEKKLQLFEEGCLFRAVLPECNDRVHGELCHCVTATGRLSSQSPNLQNIPKEEDMRRLIRSRFGPKGRMIEADYSQLEVVVLAALCRDPQMRQEMRDQVDFHCLRVSLMTKEPYEEILHKAKVLKDARYIQLRQQAKVFSFQRQYGAGVSTIATTTGLTEQEVDQLIVAEERHYKELGRYYQLVTDCVEAGADRVMRLRTLDTANWNANLRRIVMLTEPLHYFVVPTGSKFDLTKDRKSVPRLKNYPVQGLAGEIVQIMCGVILRRFYATKNYNQKAFLVNTVHDCVWVDAHESVAEQVKEDLQTIMDNTQQVISDLWPEMHLDVPFRAEIHSGTSLGEL